MFLPGMHYQDSAWESTKKALGLAALEAVHAIGLARMIDDAYFDQNVLRFREKMSAALLRMQGHLERNRNVHDRDAFALASDLVLALTPGAAHLDPALHRQLDAMRPALSRFAKLSLRDNALAEDAVQDVLIGVLERPEQFAGLPALGVYAMLKQQIARAADPGGATAQGRPPGGPQAERPKYFSVLINKIRLACQEENRPVASDSVLRKIANDVFADLRDEVDVQGFRTETGEPMNGNRLRNLRKVDEAANAVKLILANWCANAEYASLILGYPVLAEPIEQRQMLHGRPCKAEWLLRWSEHFGRFHPPGKNGQPATGKFHNRSKQFTPTPENIAELLVLLDPLTGRYHPVPSGRSNPGDFHTAMDAAQESALADIEADIVDDGHHAGRVLRPDDGVADTEWETAECADDDFLPELDQLLAAHPDPDTDTDPDGWEEHIAAEPFESSPGNGEVSAECAGEKENKADIDVLYVQELRLYLQHLALPIRVGVLRDLGINLKNDDLLDAIDHMGVFDDWELERDVNLLTNVELAKRLPKKPNGKPVSAGTVKNWIAKALEEFSAFAAQTKPKPTAASAKPVPRGEDVTKGER